MIIWVYDRFGNQIDCLGEVIDFTHDDELGKVEFIEFDVVGTPLEKGNYLVWRDEFDEWHEDIVSSCEVIHSGTIRQHIYAEDSLVELALSYINERDSYNLQNVVAMSRCLQDTRWTPVIVDNLGIGDIKFYHQSVYQGIIDMVDIWGGEIYTQKLVNANGVYARRINWVKAMGNDYGLVFYYGFDADQIERHVELDNVYTRLHVFGKGEPTYDDEGDQTGYGRRLSFADINAGKDYLEDEKAKQKWGVMGKNGLQHAEGTVIFDEIEDAEELLEAGKKYFETVTEPRVNYTANLAVLADAGMDFKNARKGDTVYIRDEVLDERLVGRIFHVRRYKGNKPTEITLGNATRTAPEIWQSQQQALQNITNKTGSWDGAASANSEWMKHMVAGLNDEINADGGFVYWDYGEGITVYDRAVDDRPSKAIQLKGGSFRIANSKNSRGEWDWSVFGTGDGFTASLINVGVLRCGTNIINLDAGVVELTNGLIIDTNGNYVNFGAGTMRFVNKAGKGMRFENGELIIDADRVMIGSENIQTWTNSKIEVVNNNITLAVNNLKQDTTSRLQVLEKEISLKVTSKDVQSAITTSLKGIDLSVTGSLGGTASIQISANGEKLDSANLNLSNVRNAFKNDTTAITISGGVVTFNSNTFVVNSTNFSVTKEGKITATAGTIGGFNITKTSLYNGKASIDSGATGVYVGTDGISLGSSFKVTKAGELTAKSGKIANFTIASNKLYATKTAISNNQAGVYIGTDGIALGANSVFKVTSAGALTASSGSIAGFTITGNMLKGKAINLGINTVDVRSSQNNFYIGSFCASWLTNDPGKRFLGVQASGNSNVYGIVFSTNASESTGSSEARNTNTIRAIYTRSAIKSVNVYSGYTTDLTAGWNFFADLNLHGVQLKEATIPTATALSIPDSIQDRIDFVAVTKINPDGTIAEYVDGCSLEFTNGILTEMVRPEGE